MATQALVKAVTSVRYTQTKLLLGLGIDVNCHDVTTGQTPLIQALQVSDPKPRANFLRLLLKSGARVSEADFKGKNALMWASSVGSYEDFLLLLRNMDLEVDLNCRSRAGQTALWLAVDGHRTDVVRELLRVLTAYEMPLEVADRDGVTPAMRAAILGHVDLLDVMVKHLERVGKSAYCVSNIKKIRKVFASLPFVPHLKEARERREEAIAARPKTTPAAMPVIRVITDEGEQVTHPEGSVTSPGPVTGSDVGSSSDIFKDNLPEPSSPGVRKMSETGPGADKLTSSSPPHRRKSSTNDADPCKQRVRKRSMKSKGSTEDLSTEKTSSTPRRKTSRSTRDLSQEGESSRAEDRGGEESAFSECQHSNHDALICTQDTALQEPPTNLASRAKESDQVSPDHKLSTSPQGGSHGSLENVHRQNNTIEARKAVESSLRDTRKTSQGSPRKERGPPVLLTTEEGGLSGIRNRTVCFPQKLSASSANADNKQKINRKQQNTQSGTTNKTEDQTASNYVKASVSIHNNEKQVLKRMEQDKNHGADTHIENYTAQNNYNTEHLAEDHSSQMSQKQIRTDQWAREVTRNFKSTHSVQVSFSPPTSTSPHSVQISFFPATKTGPQSVQVSIEPPQKTPPSARVLSWTDKDKPHDSPQVFKSSPKDPPKNSQAIIHSGRKDKANDSPQLNKPPQTNRPKTSSENKLGNFSPPNQKQEQEELTKTPLSALSPSSPKLKETQPGRVSFSPHTEYSKTANDPLFNNLPPSNRSNELPQYRFGSFQRGFNKLPRNRSATAPQARVFVTDPDGRTIIPQLSPRGDSSSFVRENSSLSSRGNNSSSPNNAQDQDKTSRDSKPSHSARRFKLREYNVSVNVKENADQPPPSGPVLALRSSLNQKQKPGGKPGPAARGALSPTVIVRDENLHWKRSTSTPNFSTCTVDRPHSLDFTPVKGLTPARPRSVRESLPQLFDIYSTHRSPSYRKHAKMPKFVTVLPMRKRSPNPVTQAPAKLKLPYFGGRRWSKLRGIHLLTRGLSKAAAGGLKVLAKSPILSRPTSPKLPSSPASKFPLSPGSITSEGSKPGPKLSTASEGPRAGSKLSTSSEAGTRLSPKLSTASEGLRAGSKFSTASDAGPRLGAKLSTASESPRIGSKLSTSSEGPKMSPKLSTCSSPGSMEARPQPSMPLLPVLLSGSKRKTSQAQ